MLAAVASFRAVFVYLCFAFPLLIYYRHTLQPSLRAPGPWSQSLYNDSMTSLDFAGKVFDDTLEGGPRIRQASMVFGGRESAVYERSLKTHIEHGQMHGYPTHFLRQDVIGEGEWVKLLFDKILYLQSLIINEMTKPYGKRSEWVVWVDADTIVLNPNIPWESFLPPTEDFSDIHLIGAKDWNGWNCGVFFVRVNAWSVEMLRDVAALPSLRPEVELSGNAEQDAMQWVFNQEENIDHIMFHPLDWYNGYEYTRDTPVVKPGDLLVHFAGYGAGKFPAMGKWLDRLETEEGLAELHIPYNQTDYPLKIKKFWSRVRSARSLLEESSQLAGENYPNITDKAAIKKVDHAHKELLQALREEAFNDLRLKTGITTLNNALEAADEVQETKEKTIVDELERQRLIKAEGHIEEDQQEALEEEEKKKKEKEEADQQNNLEKQAQRKQEEAQQKADVAKEQEAKQKAEDTEEHREKEDEGDTRNANQIERAKEQIELEKKRKEQIKAEMMKKNDIHEAMVTEGKNQLERVEEAARKIRRR